MSEAYQLSRPLQQTTSVIFASPHSGREYPAEFLANTLLDHHAIRTSEDAFVDRLFDMAPQMGAPFLAARAPRSFIDLNRAADELDPAVIEGVARMAHNPRVSSGLGVIPRVVAGGRAIYRGKLNRAEADARINRFWHPYHETLKNLMDETLATFGQAVLIDCHSMPHEAIEAHARPGHPKPEVVLGDRFGAAAGRDVMERVEAAFASAGFRVVRNAPFAGAYIAQAYGRPSRCSHVVQVEIDRALYMDEARIEPSAGFDGFRTAIGGVVAELAGIGRHGLPVAAE
ncbi:N-formylglutamate amidohydrolase [Tabrizicola sp.]|uniref:N-formylglutamate amidohydrolase n=1 Tax=Tabrizicola sp. TaxID=2005166 RepID=UPI00286A172D|nr:N-formylglutamate amidohydrolase [Tabrizicola sp.]